MLIVVERRETFHYYYPMGVHPPGDLTVTEMQFNSAAAIHAGAEDHGLFAVDPHIGQVDVIHDFGNDVFSSF